METFFKIAESHVLEKNQKFQWHIAVRTDHKKPWLLTQESFADALKWVM
jgi:hypothetical protein